MTTVENALLKQMQKLASTMTAMQGAANKDKNGQNAVSFEEMLQQSGSKTSNVSEGSKEPQDKPLKEVEEAVEEAKNPALPGKEKEELKAENLTGNPNAVAVMDLFRPEIVETMETMETVETVVNPIPQETVEGAAMDLGQQSDSFQQAMEEPAQQTVENPQTQQTAPEQPVQQEKQVEGDVEVHVERDEGEEPTSEAPMAEQPVFHESQAVPVKVGERYEVVDTQKPDMDNQLADTIRTAVQTGQEHIEIRLNPQNLGSLVIEMTKDTAGVLQVVLHAATPKAEGLLNQHLNGLQNALQGYGHEEVRLEVQRNEPGEQQQFRQADPDGRGQHQQHQQQERREEHSGEEFMQKLRLGLFGAEE